MAAEWRADVQMDVLLRGRRERGAGDETGESFEHWRRALAIMLGRLGSLRRDGAAPTFVSIAAPEAFVVALANVVGAGGRYEARVGARVGAGSRLLTCWPRSPEAVLAAYLEACAGTAHAAGAVKIVTVLEAVIVEADRVADDTNDQAEGAA